MGQSGSGIQGLNHSITSFLIKINFISVLGLPRRLQCSMCADSFKSPYFLTLFFISYSNFISYGLMNPPPFLTKYNQTKLDFIVPPRIIDFQCSSHLAFSGQLLLYVPYATTISTPDCFMCI